MRRGIAVATFDGRIAIVRNGTIERTYSPGNSAAPAFGPGDERLYAVTSEAVLAFEDGRRLCGRGSARRRSRRS